MHTYVRIVKSVCNDSYVGYGNLFSALSCPSLGVIDRRSGLPWSCDGGTGYDTEKASREE